VRSTQSVIDRVAAIGNRASSSQARPRGRLSERAGWAAPCLGALQLLVAVGLFVKVQLVSWTGVAVLAVLGGGVS
jgi:hypothetical protein